MHKRRFIRPRSNKEAFLIRSVPFWKLHCGRRQAYCTMHGLVQCGEKGVAEGGGLEERIIQQSVAEYAPRRGRRGKKDAVMVVLQEHNVSL